VPKSKFSLKSGNKIAFSIEPPPPKKKKFKFLSGGGVIGRDQSVQVVIPQHLCHVWIAPFSWALHGPEKNPGENKMTRISQADRTGDLDDWSG
jgi:hypothetical protein